MNMIGQNSPWGSLSYDQTGSTWITDPRGKRVEVPQYTANTTLTPEQQAIFDRTQRAELNMAQIAADQSARVGEILNDPFEFNNQDAETWAWDLASPRILGQQQENRNALRTQLINSGLRPGTAAFDAEMSRMDRADTDQMNQLALTGRNQAFSEALALRNQPLNEIIGLTTGTQIQNPTATFAQTPQTGVAGVDYTGLVNQQYQAQMQNYQSGMGGLFGLGGALLGAAGKAGGFGALFSDHRLKTDIERVGQTDAGTPIYRYRYKSGGPFMFGVMAQEVAETQPDAVAVNDDGFLMVDYARVH